MVESQWYFAHTGQQYGPVSLTEIRTRGASGALKPEDLVWTQGLASWTPAGNIPGLLITSLPAPTSPAPTSPAPTSPAPTSLTAPPMRRGPMRYLIPGCVAIVLVLWIAFRPKTEVIPTDEPINADTVQEVMVDSSSGIGQPPQKTFISDESRQQQTVETIKSLGDAYTSWLTDQVGADLVKATSAGKVMVSISDYRAGALTEADIENDLQPVDAVYYLQDLVLTDGWGHPLEVWRGEDLLSNQVTLIRSPGREGFFDADDYETEKEFSDDFDRDIVWVDGYFAQRPEGELPPGEEG